MARPELLAFLRSCKEEPDNLSPRLILADWLEDNGEPTLAALVRLQCRAERMPLRERRHLRVEKRVNALVRQCAAWLRPLREHDLIPSFARGLLRVTAKAGDRTRKGVGGLSRSEVWPWVESLGISGWPLSAAGLRGWLRSRLCAEVGALTLGGLTLTEEADVLAGVELPLLRTMQLYLQDGGGVALRVLGQAPFAPRLLALSLAAGYGNSIGSQGAADLAAGRWSGLRRLDLPSQQIADEGAGALAASGWVGGLSHLDLSSNNIGPRGVRALLGGPRPLSACVVLARNLIGDEGAALVAASPGLRATTSMSLPGCNIGPAGVAALAASPGATALTTLDLSNNHIGDEGAEALARSPFLANLTGLSLYHSDSTSRGALALASSPHLRRLAAVALHANLLSEDTRRVLRERFGRGARF